MTKTTTDQKLVNTTSSLLGIIAEEQIKENFEIDLDTMIVDFLYEFNELKAKLLFNKFLNKLNS